jgi:lipoyl(octanoyl) transferase
VNPRAQAFRFNKPVPYQPAAEAMERLVEDRLQNRTPDTVLFLEHQPVVTLGSRGRDSFLLKTPAELEAEGVHVAHATRGGDVTFHGPGQLVMYPILALGPSETDTHRYLASLEETAIRACTDFGVTAFRVPGKTGAWTADGKIAAIGVRVRRWITSHGMSFNISVDLRYTSWIVPCGLVGQPVTSLRQILGEACPALADVREHLRLRLAEVMNRTVEWSDGPLPEALASLAAYRD